MKNLRLILSVLCLSFVGLDLFGQGADADYAAFQALVQEKPPGRMREIGAEKYLRWWDDHLLAMKSAALAFQAAHPTDPRRWELLMTSVNQPPRFIKGFGPDLETKRDAAVIVDEAAAADWRKQGEMLTEALLVAKDVPPAVREDVEWRRFRTELRAARTKGEAPDHTRFHAHLARYAELDVLAERAVEYLGAIERNVPGSTETIWKQLLTAPNAALRAQADERVKYFDRLVKPIDIAFTAVDGRAVDLKSLRGKVVLVDFWATWCGPCIEEIPGVRKVYAAYHDKGFEVIGITLEDAFVKPTDTPEQAAAKLNKAKRVLTAFTTKENMPWPQFFDGKGGKNDFVLRYDIQGIPAMFLLDQEGRLVSKNARGEILEKEVKRLLKL